MEGLVSQGPLERPNRWVWAVLRVLQVALQVCCLYYEYDYEYYYSAVYTLSHIYSVRRSTLVLGVHTAPRKCCISHITSCISQDREAMLRQRKEDVSASAAAEAPRPLDSDEQEKVLMTIAQEARRQTTFFTVSG